MRFLVPTTLSAVCAALALGAVTAQVALAVPAGSTVVLPKGTSVRLRLDTDLKAGESKEGQQVMFTVDQNVYGPNHALLLTKGASASGHIVKSAAHDLFGRRGRLTFTCDTVQPKGRVQVPVNLVVGSGSGAAADAADEMDAQEYYFFNLDPLPTDGYTQSATPGYYTQHSGLTVSTVYDPGRQFGGSPVATAKRGDKFTAKVAADTPVPALP